MSKFMDLMDEYLELRDDLKDAENNFASIGDRQYASKKLAAYRLAINDFVDSVQQSLTYVEKDVGDNR